MKLTEVTKAEKKEEISIHVPEIKVEPINLPSKCLPYPPGVIIKYKPYTYGEILKFNQSKLGKAGNIEFILEGVITEGIKKTELALLDFLFISILRRISSFESDQYTVTFDCNNCGKSNRVSQNISKIEFDDLNVESLPIVLDTEYGELHFKPITVAQHLDLLKSGIDDSIAVYAKQIINKPYDEAYKIIYNATGDLKEDLETLDKLLYFGPKPLECKCNSCKFINTVAIDNPEVVVEPFRDSKGPVGSRIRFMPKA